VIAVDTSALIAIVLREPQAAACQAALEVESGLLISAATLAEVLIVAGRRNIAEEMRRLIEAFSFEIVPVSESVARRAADVHRRCGRGSHPARLNFGDCFAYDLAKEHDCLLLFVGDDFARTDATAAS
jgi:ribonuclease VapC